MGFFVAFWAAVATLLMLPSSFGGAAPAAAAATGPAGRNCTTSCGSISIQYPLGIEPGCYHGPGFNLTCASRGHGPPELFLGDGTVQLLEISVEHSTLLYHDNNSSRTTSRTWGVGIPERGPYFLSESTNILEAIGCNIQVNILAGVNNRRPGWGFVSML
nr:unnamed protein product [Digitaria exilis]